MSDVGTRNAADALNGGTRRPWIAACALGEALGIAAVATTYAALDRGLVANATVWILIAGAWEGLSLGSAQALVLRRFGIVPLAWIALTMAGAIVGYGLSLLGGAGGSDSAEEPSLALIIVLGAGMGVAMGALMGAFQSLGARRILSPRKWIVANMAGWALAMPVIMAAATSVERSFPLALITAIGAASGGVAGAALGIVTSLALPHRAR